MLLGVDYYPEQWPKEMLESDLDRIVEMGASAIRIGEFAWHLIESQEGHFDFSFFDHVIARAVARGLKVVYGTPTATFPAWVAHRYPKVLSIDELGHPRAFGGRRQYCYNSRDYWRLTEIMVEKLVSHYREVPELTMWQLDNELGHEGSDACYCPQCHEDFQTFLSDKYQTIHNLNQVYGTMFWGQTYNEFAEIPMPTPTITTHNPTLKMDWLRFRSFSIERFAQRQLHVIKSCAGTHQPVTHNFYGGYFDRQFDQTKVSQGLDIVAYDNYPVWGGLMHPLSPAEIAMGHSYMYGLKEAPFWVMEQLIGAQGHDDIGYLPLDGESTLWASQAMGKGCNSLFYFRYRGAVKGAEQYCQGILDADNRINDKFREVQRFYNWCRRWQSIIEKPLAKASVALVYSYDNRQAWRGQRQSSDFNYTRALLDFYDAFHHINVAVDVIDISKEWQKYPVVIMPVMQIITPQLAEALKAYVSQGGTLISGYRAFIKDSDNNLPFGETAPCYVNDLFGIEVAAYEALGDGQTRTAQGATLSVLRELLKTKTAIGHYAYGAPYQDAYALTENTYNRGKAYYVGGGLDTLAHRTLAQKVACERSLPWTSSPEGLEVIQRESDHGPVWLILNHNHEAVYWREHVFKPLAVEWMPVNFDASTAGIMPNGEAIKRVKLQSDQGFEVEVITLGASLTEVWAANAIGKRGNVCLNYKSYSDYLENPFYLGCTIGRTAGRMREGEFLLDETKVKLDTSKHPHGIHGGHMGLSHVNWRIVHQETKRLTLGYDDSYCEGKTPGSIRFLAHFEILEGATLKVTYEAKTDSKTFINLTNHTYFKLSEAGLGQMQLRLAAQGYFEVDSEQLPRHPLQKTPTHFDFSQTKPLSEALSVGLDHPFVLNRQDSPQIELSDPTSGRCLRIWTDQRAAVIYSGNYLAHGTSPSGQKYDKQEGICFETQDVPDAPNLYADTISIWTTPEKPYRHETLYDFTPMSR